MNVNEIASLGRVAEVQKTFDEIFHGFYQKNMNHLELVEVKEYYQVKVAELLLYLNVMTVDNRKEVRAYY